MARRNLLKDASEFAASELEYALDEIQAPRAPSVPSIPVADAVRGAGVYEVASDRTTTRVLFISQDESLLNPTTQSLDGFLELSTLFAEVHILILRQGRPSPKPVLRVSENVWIYTATAKNWWWTPRIGWRCVLEQLVFADGFRPDLIVARDPFESALVGQWVSTTYARPLQIHILQDFYTDEWQQKDTHALGRRWLAWYNLRQAVSVRTMTQALATKLRAQYPAMRDLQVMPRFRNYASLLTVAPTVDLKERFKPLIFFMSYIGPLTHESQVYRALDAARFVLRNPRVGLLVLGDGPALGEFQKRAKILAIDQQVVFATRVTDATAVLKSTNILLIPDTDSDSDELALKAAALGVPMVMAKTELREDVFVDGVSAFLYDRDDVQTLANCINELLNEIGLRRQFSDRCQMLIAERFKEDPESYRKAFRGTIEAAILLDDEPVATTEA
jgi:glycosyltransferase involved in cell wall biosynthesis